jgi:hypothetical protein
MASAPSTSIVIRNLLLLLLTCTAGYLDALSYRGLERVFTANMTGNTVLLGLALVEADSHAVLRFGLALAGFLVGSAWGAWVVERGRPASVWPPPVTGALVLEWVLLLAFAAGWQWASGAVSLPATRAILIVLAALAMGVQSAAVRRLGHCDDLYHRDADALRHTAGGVGTPWKCARGYTDPGGRGISWPIRVVGIQCGPARHGLVRVRWWGRGGSCCPVAGPDGGFGHPSRPAAPRHRHRDSGFLAAVAWPHVL